MTKLYNKLFTNLQRYSVISLISTIAGLSLFGSFTANADNSIKQTVNDTAITAKVKTSLLTETDLPGTSIKVTTEGNIVHLAGELDTRLQYNRAIEIANSIEGVADVDYSNLKLKHDLQNSLEDSVITAKAYGKLTYLSGKNLIARHAVRMETHDGVLHVWGELASTEDKDKLYNNLKTIHGVKSVMTNITIK